MQAAGAASTAVRSVSGSRLSGGQISEDPNQDLRGRGWVEAYEKLLLDPQVQSARRAIKDSQLASKLSFQAATGPDDEVDEESAAAADWLNRKFGLAGYAGEMRRPIESQLRTLLDFQFLGYRYAEEVYRRDTDGEWFLWYYKDCHPRAHRDWLYDEHEGFAGIRQNDVSGLHEGEDPPEVKAGKLLLLTLDQEGANFEGRGILRPSWYWAALKLLASDMIGVGCERTACGIPSASYDREALLAAGFDDNQIDGKDNHDSLLAQLEAALAEISAGESAQLIFPKGVETSVAFNDAFDPERLGYVVSMCDQQILTSMLAQYLLLGQQGSGGAYALIKSQMDLFLEAGKNVMDMLCQSIGGPAGPGTGTAGRLLNWHTRFYALPQDRRPRLVHSGLDGASLEVLGEVIPKLKAAGEWTAQNTDESWLRSKAGAPPLAAENHRSSLEREDTDPLTRRLRQSAKS